MKKKFCINLSVGIVIFSLWILSLYALYVKEKGFFVEKKKLEKYQEFIKKNLPYQKEYRYGIYFQNELIGLFQSEISTHPKEAYFENKQELVLNFSNTYFIIANYKSENNMDGSLLNLKLFVKVNSEEIVITGSMLQRKLLLFIESKKKKIKRVINLPKNYLTINLFSPININFNKFVMNNLYELNAYIPILANLPMKIYIKGIDVEKIKMRENFSVDAYHLKIVSEDKSFISDIWVNKENVILMQSFFDLLTLKMISYQKYKREKEKFLQMKTTQGYVPIPDLVDFFDKGISLIAKKLSLLSQ